MTGQSYQTVMFPHFVEEVSGLIGIAPHAVPDPALSSVTVIVSLQIRLVILPVAPFPSQSRRSYHQQVDYQPPPPVGVTA